MTVLGNDFKSQKITRSNKEVLIRSILSCKEISRFGQGLDSCMRERSEVINFVWSRDNIGVSVRELPH